MIANETLKEMLRIVRASSRMCKEHPSCDGCPARNTNCELVGNNNKLAYLIRIIDRYDREREETKQDVSEVVESKEAPAIEERLHELELYRQQMQLWAENFVQRIEKIEEHAAHHDHCIVCNCVHVDDDTADVAPVRHAHWMPWEEMLKVQIETKNRMLGVFCSACGSHGDMPRNYCHECGAKMDEKVRK